MMAEEGRRFCHHDMGHFLDVARLAMIFNLQQGLSVSKEMIYAAALLHDIGRWNSMRTGTDTFRHLKPQECGDWAG